MLKCIECDGIAEYIYKGSSLCKEHLDYESSNGKTNEAEYFNLLKNFKGRENALNYFWRKCEGKYPSFSFYHKCKWLTRVNKVVESNNISGQVISDALFLAIKRSIYDIGFIIKVVQTTQAKITKDKSIENSNDDVYEQIAKNTSQAP